MKPDQVRTLGLLAVGLAAAGAFALVDATADAADDIYVPGAAHVAGSNNTSWRTDLEIRSVGTLGARVRIDLLRKGRDNTNHPSIILELDAGTARRYDDALDLLFGYQGTAALRLTTLDGEIRATSRTYNVTPNGTFGQFIGGSTAADAFATGLDATLIQLTASAGDEEGFRTNLGFVNLQGIPAELTIDLYHANLEYLGRVSTGLEPYEFNQIDGIFGRVTTDAVPDGIAIIRATSTGARYLAYASVIDNLTGDPIFIPGLANTAAVQPMTPTPTPTGQPSATPTPTATPTRTPTPPLFPVVVTTVDEHRYELLPSSIRFRVGSGVQTSLVLCSFDGTLSQVASSNFSFIKGPTEPVGWANCCSSTSSGARLEYETFIGVGGLAVARSTCTPGTPVFAIIGADIDTGAQIEIAGENLDLALWP